MAVESAAEATWNGDLTGGRGSVRAASGALDELALTWRARAESRASGTSPEELIAAAHAACFSMALAHGLGQAGTPPERIQARARVGFQAGQGITGIALSVTGKVPGLDRARFREAAEAAKAGCPVSRALAGVPITLESADLET
ncbi:MAG TPA: OsmC family peroxiredoxin [Candidatus Dormibacteraeota bacterium]|jgi:osmotically inducible protein OsmC|nr:OsmC family peroxiredoxin [Candidatus Dormibacteraeota bacterium]